MNSDRFRWIVVALLAGLLVLGVYVVVRPEREPSPADGDRAAEIACLEGGGTWATANPYDDPGNYDKMFGEQCWHP